MLYVAVCDDHHRTAQRYAAKIRECAQRNNVEVEISCYHSGDSLLLEYFETRRPMDIIYLDIIMDKTDGLEVARSLRAGNCHAQIIFLTSCEDYVYEAFDVSAAQYLIKENFSLEKFERVFMQAVMRASEKEDALFVAEFDGVKIAMPIHSISYFEIWNRVVTAYYDGDKTARFYETMESLESRLDARDFVRVHRSYLVHLPYIAQFQPKHLLLKTGAVIPIGVTYASVIRQAFSDYISRFHVFDP